VSSSAIWSGLTRPQSFGEMNTSKMKHPPVSIPYQSVNLPPSSSLGHGVLSDLPDLRRSGRPDPAERGNLRDLPPGDVSWMRGHLHLGGAGAEREFGPEGGVILTGEFRFP
jgi:hypothetical protein